MVTLLLLTIAVAVALWRSPSPEKKVPQSRRRPAAARGRSRQPAGDAHPGRSPEAATIPTAWAVSGRAIAIFRAGPYLNPTTIRSSARASRNSTRAGAKAPSATIFPLPAGVYELRLHFAETLYGENNVAGGGESSRVFNVWINDKEALHEFDVINEAGPSTADIRAFKDISPAPDGKLHIRFEPFSNPPLLSAIEIIPGTPHRLRPIRMVALDAIYSDKQGRVWEPDRYARSGTLVVRTKPVEGSVDSDLLRGERFGNLRYMIPVPPGRYGVTFYFCRGLVRPRHARGRRSRQSGLRHSLQRRGSSPWFRCLQRGPWRRPRRDLERPRTSSPTPRESSISRWPFRNYACVNAVEVVDESK